MSRNISAAEAETRNGPLFGEQEVRPRRFETFHLLKFLVFSFRSSCSLFGRKYFLFLMSEGGALLALPWWWCVFDALLSSCWNTAANIGWGIYLDVAFMIYVFVFEILNFQFKISHIEIYCSFISGHFVYGLKSSLIYRSLSIFMWIYNIFLTLIYDPKNII